MAKRRMDMRTIKLITFDVTGTLLKLKRPPGTQYGDVGSKHGIQCDPHVLSRNFKVHWRKMNDAHPNFGLKSGLGWRNWWREIVLQTFNDCGTHVEVGQLERISSHLIEMYQTEMCWQSNAGTLDLLSYLMHRKIPIGVVSNFDPRLDTILANLRLKHYFRFVAASYNVGVAKPDPHIFSQSLIMSGVRGIRPCECLHVGDSALADYKGARDAGWQAALICNDEKSLETHDFVRGDHVFATLFDFHKTVMEHLEV